MNTDNENSNMMWNYNLTLTALAPLSLVLDQASSKGSLKRSLKTSVIQKGVNLMLNQLSNLEQKWATDIIP